MKRLMNRTEAETNEVLRNLTENWGAHVFPKVRVADVLPIENSGISDDLYRFALRSHFDFTVTDDGPWPLFAVEFDGDAHFSERQRRRDSQKGLLCERFDFPLLRINSRYIQRRYRQMDLLSWFVIYWFAQRMIDDAYESGSLPIDAGVDPLMCVDLPGTSRRFPLWLSADVRIAFERFYEQGQCVDPGPSVFVGSDDSGAFHAIAYMAVSDAVGLVAETAMRAQQFNVPCAEVVEAIADHQIYEEFLKLVNGKTGGVALDAVHDRVCLYGQRFEMSSCAISTQSERLRAASPKLFC
jgi:hypothetical protein